MQAWIIYYYGDNQQFTLSDSVQMPIILSPKDVIIKISASSINPVDIRRRGKLISEKILLIKLIF
jgi:NADPH:quinone reductase-like Zn-dependent oxidoreductase